jgi:hypothetical protein
MRLDTRKQIEPSASGRQTCDPPVSAANVLTLKKSVPGNWIAADHQSLHAGLRQARPLRRPVRSHWVNDADVKHSEPMKYVALSAWLPTSDANPGTAAIAKHSEPTANSRASQRCSESRVRTVRGRAAWEPVPRRRRRRGRGP